MALRRRKTAPNNIGAAVTILFIYLVHRMTWAGILRVLFFSLKSGSLIHSDQENTDQTYDCQHSSNIDKLVEYK